MSKAKLPSNAPRVFSYLRFSTPEQKLGDSERRQVDAAKKWAADHKLQFDESLKDEGLSGFHGTNRKRGALGAFLKKVEAGKVPRGSILVVENVDRLSREDFLTAFDTIRCIVTNGITIQTLSPSAEYNRESLTGGMVYGIVAQIQMAHEESKKKSERITASRKACRIKAHERRRLITAKVPAWLKPKMTTDGDNKPKYNLDEPPDVISAAAKTIRQIFKLKLDGFSTRRIEAKLNASAPWTPPRNPKRKTHGWRASYIKKILTNRAVIGECQLYVGRNGERKPIGEPIKDYFPAIVEPQIFFAVQEQFKANKGKGGRTGAQKNLFVHLVKCAYCGGPMKMRGHGSSPKGGDYLICYNADHKLRDDQKQLVCTDRQRIRLDECERTILQNCHLLRPKDVLPSDDEREEVCQSLNTRISGLEGQLADTEKNLANANEWLTRKPSKAIIERVTTEFERLERDKTELQSQLSQLQAERIAAEQDRESFKAWKVDFDTLQKSLKDVDVRVRLARHLREIIGKIECFTRGHRKFYDPEAHEAAQRLVSTELGLKYNPKHSSVNPRFAAVWRDSRVREARDGEDLANRLADVMLDSAPELLRSKSDRKRFGEFLTKATARRMSKEGRFLRLHFKTGIQIDIVPDGSLADGRKLVDDEGQKRFEFESPGLEKLWREFIDQQTQPGTNKPKRRRLLNRTQH